MKRLKGINGIVQTAVDNNVAETEKISATLDYVAMMADVEIPTEDNAEEEAAE